MALGKTIREFGVKVSLLFDKAKVEESKKAIDGVALGMKGIAVEVATAATALLGLASISSANSRTLEQNSQQLGLNVEQLQELEYAAKVAAGVSRDELTGALEGLSKTLFEARNNNFEASRTLIRMGVPLDLITGKMVHGKRVFASSSDVLLNLSDRFKAMPDGINKTALATETFGGAGAKLIPLLNKGAAGIAAMGKEGRSLGVILSSDVIKKGAEFDRQLSKIWIILKNVTYTIGSELIKYLGPMVIQFQNFIVANKKFIALGIAQTVKNLGIYLKIVFGVVSILAKKFKELVMILGGVKKVTATLALAFGLFTGFKIVGNVLKLVGAVQLLLRAFIGLSGPVGIAITAITGLYFILRDLFSSDSVIKKWFSNFSKSLPELVDAFQKEFPEIAETISDLMETFKAKFPNLTKLFKGVFDIGLAGFQKAAEWLDILIKKVDEFGDKFGVFKKLSDFGDRVAEITGNIGDLLSQLAKGKAPDLSATAGQIVQASKAVAPTVASPAQYMAEKSLAQSNTINHGDTNMNATINVTVPRGTQAAEASEIVSGGVQKGFHAILRQTRDQFLGGVAQ